MNFRSTAAMVLFFFFIGHSSFAEVRIQDFSGNWSGKGVYIHDGDLTTCSVMKLEFFANNMDFSFMGGERICEKHNEIFYRVDMSYKDGLVFIGNMMVGTYSENLINVSFSQPEGNGNIRHWRMSMRVEGNHLIYEESRTMNNESTPLISFSGMLIRN